MFWFFNHLTATFNTVSNCALGLYSNVLFLRKLIKNCISVTNVYILERDRRSNYRIIELSPFISVLVATNCNVVTSVQCSAVKYCCVHFVDFSSAGLVIGVDHYFFGPQNLGESDYCFVFFSLVEPFESHYQNIVRLVNFHNFVTFSLFTAYVAGHFVVTSQRVRLFEVH